ncbi:class I adenylate-forming enzyme family protein [Tistrella mobilis]|uniref:class I adenylate-forming enzyme family protein n=1 Tax=Tistrella mobilis TaxID=171437 RepID=UPI0035560447
MPQPQLIPPEIPGEAFIGFARRLATNAARFPGAPAVIDENRRLDWGSFAELVARIAGGLRMHGIGRGDMVATLASNSVEHIAVYCAIIHAGACVVPLPWSATEAALQLMLKDCGARILFASAAHADTARKLGAEELVMVETLENWISWARPIPPVDVQPTALINMIYSSGTTGAPKGIVHDQRFRARQAGRVAQYGVRPGARSLISTPLYSNTTLFLALPTLASGATLISMSRFDTTRFLEVAQVEHVTHAVLVPVQYTRLMDTPGFDAANLSAFICKFSTSAPLPAAMKAQVMARWPGNLIELYGMTEGGVSVMLDCAAHPDKLDTVGRPSPGADIRIIDEDGNELPPGAFGEIVGRSGAMMQRYHNQPEKTAEIIWRSPEGLDFIRSGDMGRFDADGFLQLLDRKKDMIISGGFNIYATDLEAALRSHPAVADVAVIGVPSDAWGETPLGLVVLRPGHDATPQALCDHANTQLGKTQRLSAVELRDSLPRSEIGKVLKRELRAPYWAKATA